jgi:excisionase family DNA binding protein
MTKPRSVRPLVRRRRRRRRRPSSAIDRRHLKRLLDDRTALGPMSRLPLTANGIDLDLIHRLGYRLTPKDADPLTGDILATIVRRELASSTTLLLESLKTDQPPKDVERSLCVMAIPDGVVSVSVDEVCDLLGCGRTKAFELLRQGKLKRAPRQGKKRMVDADSVRRLINVPTRRLPATPEPRTPKAKRNKTAGADLARRIRDLPISSKKPR